MCETVKQALLYMRSGAKLNKRYGICANLYNNLIDEYPLQWIDSSTITDAVDKLLYKHWEHYSKEGGFPIPHKTRKATDAFLYCSKWDKRSNYGKMRYNALEFLIANSDKLEVRDGSLEYIG